MNVKLSVPSALLFKDGRREKLWSAIHALITNALHEPEVDEEEEEGQVEISEPTQQQEQEQEQQVVDVTFWESYFEDPSGLWTDLLQREGLQSNLEYDMQNSSIIGMSEEEAQAFHSTVGFSATSSSARKPNKACFNCGEVGHEVATCPMPIDKRRIASNKGGGGGGRGGGAHARYHEPEKFAKFKLIYQPGQISSELKGALGVQEDPFVAIRKRLGEPPINTTVTEQEEEESEESEEEEEKEGVLAEVDFSPPPPAPTATPCQHDVPGELWSKRVLPLCNCPQDCPRAHGRYVYVPPPTTTPSPQPPIIKRTRYENDEGDVPQRTSSAMSSDRGRRNRSGARYRRRSPPPAAPYRQSYSPYPPAAYASAPQYPTPPPHQQQQAMLYPSHYQMQPYPTMQQQQVPYGTQYPSYPQPPPPPPPNNNNNSASQRSRRPVSYDGY